MEDKEIYARYMNELSARQIAFMAALNAVDKLVDLAEGDANPTKLDVLQIAKSLLAEIGKANNQLRDEND